jgi:hypothetical protein
VASRGALLGRGIADQVGGDALQVGFDLGAQQLAEVVGQGDAAVSGYGGEGERRKSQEAGFDRHLVKPIGRATLEELIKSAAGA